MTRRATGEKANHKSGKIENNNRREGDEGTIEEQGVLLWQGVDDVEVSNEICRIFFHCLWNFLIKY